MKRSSSSPSSLARAMSITLVIVCCWSLLPCPCSAVCKGRAFGNFGQGAGTGPRGGENVVHQLGGQGVPRGGDQPYVGPNGVAAGGNQVGRTPPAPRGKTPQNHR
ncbi:hypothetical protein VPH35_057183 [Triticum aestivum]